MEVDELEQSIRKIIQAKKKLMQPHNDQDIFARIHETNFQPTLVEKSIIVSVIGHLLTLEMAQEEDKESEVRIPTVEECCSQLGYNYEGQGLNIVSGEAIEILLMAESLSITGKIGLVHRYIHEVESSRSTAF